MSNTRNVLCHVTDAVLDWQAHPSLHSIRWVASHLVDIRNWSEVILREPSFDVAPPGQPPHATTEVAHAAEILPAFDHQVATARELVASTSDEAFGDPWSLLQGGEVLMTMPRLAVYRTFIMNHSIHHRAHFCVYLRMNDIELPFIYG